MNPRVISGSAKGQKLSVPERGTRPMTDRVKSALFSMLTPRVQDSDILDLYAGTGALGIECLSRGSASAVFVDRSKDAVDCINSNLNKTGFINLSRVIKCSVARFLDEFDSFSLKSDSYSIIFVCPPHTDVKESIIERASLHLKNDGVLIAEHSSTRKLPDVLENLQRVDQRIYGITSLSFYQKQYIKSKNEN